MLPHVLLCGMVAGTGLPFRLSRLETIASGWLAGFRLWTVDPGRRFPYIRALYFPCFAAARVAVRLKVRPNGQ